ncbi:type II secretion system F family protein [Candidatus Protofrankia californiensis]|uniref:type II secretion system F family protein n=1 Tax=Candidatus Protofrankia californiensis TaxID=1839754 RepID=UPI001F49F1C9|nr:type II secretion system F family protein [Candidatus Protofrankia californiensis]
MIGSAAVAGCGAMVGAGVWLAGKALRPRRPSLVDDLALLDAPPATPEAVPITRRLARNLTETIERIGWRRLLLADDLALADREPDSHTLARLIHLLAGVAVGAFAGVAVRALVGISALAVPLLAASGMAFGLLFADRPVRRLATTRRTEAALAVASYIDIVRILLVGGLPLHTALRAAADHGTGWAFTHLRGALTAARDAGLPPDAGFDQLARRLPVAEFTDLARTVTTARRGASPVAALESRATAIRAAEAATRRAEEAVADAQIELPSAIVAIAFVGYLTYPLLMLIGTGTPQ